MESFRRSQFIVPFGVGAIHTLKGGVTVITAGLDYWFTNNRSAELADVSLPNFDEFRLQDDKRFLRRLGVDYLMQPPEFRVAQRGQDTSELSNLFLPVPVFRFPNWHICPSCGTMYHIESSTPGRLKCQHCNSKSTLNQTRFIVACEDGDVMDFPWREWVFRKKTEDLNPSEKSARLEYKGGNSVNDISIKAYEASGKALARRTLAGAFGSVQTPDGLKTKLSSNLLTGKNNRFTCRGYQAWLKTAKKNDCGRDIQPTLISASNAYFAQVKTSIYIPTEIPDTGGTSLSDLYEILFQPGVYGDIDMLRGMNIPTESIATTVKNNNPTALKSYKVEDIIKVLELDEAPVADEAEANVESSETQVADDEDDISQEVRYRYDEYLVLSAKDRDLAQIKLRQVDSKFASPDLKSKIKKVVCVERLKETRALVGFSRIVAETPRGMRNNEELLRLTEPSPNNHWLPATEVYGEGLFIQFSEKELGQWEDRANVSSWAKSLQEKYDNLDRETRDISPRFLMIHTFAHILINQLVFECGYSSASLRERLYVSRNKESKMAGLLIYTAAGDSDGTLGGLIRLGKKELLEPMILAALEKATWCSSDPVCAEAEFQGTDNCNKAACHNCAIISETSCEEFNRFLDRTVVVNNSNKQEIGFFNL